MDAGSFRHESHIAQQSRRYKLRIQQTSPHHLREFPGDSEQLPLYPTATGVLQVRSDGDDTMLNCDPPVLPSEIAGLASNLSSSHRGDGIGNRSMRGHEDCALITNVSNYVVLPETSLDMSTRAGAGDPQGCGGGWRGLSLQGSDWMVNYAGGSGVSEVLSNNARVSCLSTSTDIPHQQFKPPHFDGFHDHVQLESREMKFTQHHLEQSEFDQVVAPASIRDSESDHLIPSGNTQSIYQRNLHVGNGSYLVSRPVEIDHRWGDGLGHLARKSDQELRTTITDASTHGLSLSLSSNPTTKMDIVQFGEHVYNSDFLQQTKGNEKGSDEDFKLIKLSSNSGAMPRPSIISRSCGKSLQDLVSPSTYAHRSTGPLGPFTGYATILKSSRFLKPAQELLDEICSGTTSISARASEASSDAMSGNFSNSALAGGLNAVVAEAEAKGNCNSSMSPSTFHSSNDGSGDGGVGSSLRDSFWPEYQQKKAKLLLLQEEVCRRYKQYHQQMQIVASSFELVAGLDAATPFLSLALKAVSRSFRCLKHAISDQLKQITQALGEDFLSANPGATSSKVDAGIPGLRYLDQSFQKHRSGGANVGFLEPQQHSWRPQRGLPERAVAILRAWLFEHFLHPYPTDTDKHMLATRTGLSRNQVSNWFINARVRVWKPMVEEIHMLETKGVVESNQSSRKNDASSCQGSRQANAEQPLNKLSRVNSMVSKQVDCSGMGFAVGNEEQFGTEQWDQEKRSTSEFHTPTNMDGSSMSFLPYHRNGLDIGSLGTVSLTLGLRHGVDNVQHQQVQQHEDQLMRHQFGGQMIHDFTV